MERWMYVNSVRLRLLARSVVQTIDAQTCESRVQDPSGNAGIFTSACDPRPASPAHAPRCRRVECNAMQHCVPVSVWKFINTRTVACEEGQICTLSNLSRRRRSPLRDVRGSRGRIRSPRSATLSRALDVPFR
jgi:hypothetical protein